MNQQSINLSTASLTDLDRVISLQMAARFAEHFGFPPDRAHLEPLAIAFGNGVAYARQVNTPEKVEQIRKQLQPLIDEIFPNPKH